MKFLEVKLIESEVKILLEALIEQEKRYMHICDSSDDEDEIADVGNDLIELRLLLNPLQNSALNKFGDQVLNFSRELL